MSDMAMFRQLHRRCFAEVNSGGQESPPYIFPESLFLYLLCRRSQDFSWSWLLRKRDNFQVSGIV